MTTSHRTLTTTTPTGDVLSAGDLAYFRERQSNRVYEAVFKAFVGAGITKADLARKLKKKPEQITRWLSGPGNWTLDTVSDLLLALGSEMTFVVTNFNAAPQVNIQPYQSIATTGLTGGVNTPLTITASTSINMTASTSINMTASVPLSGGLAHVGATAVNISNLPMHNSMAA
jgi:hypothetical protein